MSRARDNRDYGEARTISEFAIILRLHPGLPFTQNNVYNMTRGEAKTSRRRVTHKQLVLLLPLN